MSSVGKSLIVAALCRIFKQDGLRVAPFKAQNMALNSYATLDGREVGRAQAMQADAAGVDVTVEMNPVLIKPEADAFAQIVVMGRPWARLPAGEYMSRRGELWEIVTGALNSLRAKYDLIVMEGAGSPAELNLTRGDLVNMVIAEYADAPVILVGDIDRGGIFAQLLGTHSLLEQDERARIKAFIVNKFRGDPRLFDDGVKILEARSSVKVLGVVPFIRDLKIADEDSVALEETEVVRRTTDDADWAERSSLSTSFVRPLSHVPGLPSPVARPLLDIVVIRLPHISNFDDFDPLRAEPDVGVRFVDKAGGLGRPDLVIIPGTKTTVADLAFLREVGLASRIVELASEQVPILGICGGYQMLGKVISDPLRVESDQTQVEGLGLLPLITTFEADKHTVRARGCILADRGLVANARDLPVVGYEIHMGRTTIVERAATSGPPALASVSPFIRVVSRGDQEADDLDGAVSADGMIAGTYFHGWFENDAPRAALLDNLAARKGTSRRTSRTHFDRGAEYERLAAVVRANLDMQEVYRMIGALQ